MLFSYPNGFFDNSSNPTYDNARFVLSSFGAQSLSLDTKQLYSGTGVVTTITLNGMKLGSPQPAKYQGFTVSTKNAFASLPFPAPSIGGQISIVSFAFSDSVVKPGDSGSKIMTFQSNTALNFGDTLTLSFPSGFIHSANPIVLLGLGNLPLTSSFAGDSSVVFTLQSTIVPSSATTVTLQNCIMSQQPMRERLTLSSNRDYGIPSAPIQIGIPITQASMNAALQTGLLHITIVFELPFDSPRLLTAGDTVTLSYPNAFFSMDSFSFSCCGNQNDYAFSSPGFGLNSIVFSVQNSSFGIHNFIVDLSTTLGAGRFGPAVSFTLSTSISPSTTVAFDWASAYALYAENGLVAAPTFIISDNDRIPGATSVTVKSQFSVPNAASSSNIFINFPVAFLSPGSNFGIIVTANGNSVPVTSSPFGSSFLEIRSQSQNALFVGNISVVLLGCTLGAATQGSSTGIVISGDRFYIAHGIPSGVIGPAFASVSAEYAVSYAPANSSRRMHESTEDAHAHKTEERFSDADVQANSENVNFNTSISSSRELLQLSCTHSSLNTCEKCVVNAAVYPAPGCGWCVRPFGTPRCQEGDQFESSDGVCAEPVFANGDLNPLKNWYQYSIYGSPSSQCDYLYPATTQAPPATQAPTTAPPATQAPTTAPPPTQAPTLPPAPTTPTGGQITNLRVVCTSAFLLQQQTNISVTISFQTTIGGGLSALAGDKITFSFPAGFFSGQSYANTMVAADPAVEISVLAASPGPNFNLVMQIVSGSIAAASKVSIIIGNLAMGADLTAAASNGFSVFTSSDPISASARSPAIISPQIPAQEPQMPLYISFFSSSPMPAGSTVTLSLNCGGLPCFNIQDATLAPPNVVFNVGPRVTGLITYESSGNTVPFVQPVGFLVANQSAQFEDVFIQGSMDPATLLSKVSLKLSLTTGSGGNQFIRIPLSFGSDCLDRAEMNDASIPAMASSTFSVVLDSDWIFFSQQLQFPWTDALNQGDITIGATVAVMFQWTALASPGSFVVSVPIISSGPYSGPYMAFPSNPVCSLFDDGVAVMQLQCSSSNAAVLICTIPTVQPPVNQYWRSFQFGCGGVTMSQMPFQPSSLSTSPSISLTGAYGSPLIIPLPPIFPLSLTVVTSISRSPSFFAPLAINFPSAFDNTWTISDIAMFSSAFANDSSYSVTAAISNPNSAPPSNTLNAVANLSVAVLLGPTQPSTYLFQTNGWYVPVQALPLGNAWASVVLIVPPTGKMYLQDCKIDTSLCSLNLNSSAPPLQAPSCTLPASALTATNDAPVIVSAYTKHSSAPSASSDTHGNNRKLLQTSPGQANSFSYVADVRGVSLTSGSTVSNFTASLYTIPPPPSCVAPCYSLSLTSLKQRPWCNFQNFTNNLLANPNITGFTCIGDSCAAATCIVDPFLCTFCTVVAANKQVNVQTAQCCDPPALGASASCALCINAVDNTALANNAPPPPVYFTSIGPQTCTNPFFIQQFRSPSGLSVNLDVSNLGFTPLPSVTPGAALPFSSFESCVTQVQAAFDNRNFQVVCPNEEANIQFLQYPFNVLTPSVRLDGLDGSIKRTCSGSVCSTSAALVSCNVLFPGLNIRYEGFPYYFTPVMTAKSAHCFSHHSLGVLCHCEQQATDYQGPLAVDFSSNYICS
jgi:hypothetical protein